MDEITKLKAKNTQANIAIIVIAVVMSLVCGVLIYWLHDVKTELQAYKNVVNTACEVSYNKTLCETGIKMLLNAEKK